MSADFSAAFGSGDAAAALEFARAQVAAQPSDAEAYRALSVALKRSGDLPAARAAIDEAIRLDPERAELHMNRGALALDAGDLALAERYVGDALALDPNLISGYTSLVHFALVQGRSEEAERNLKLAQRVDPDHPQVKVAEGQWLLHRGETEQALRVLTAAIERAPDYALAQASIGLAYLKHGNLAFAEQALRNAIALEGANPGVLRALVEVCRRQDKLTEALEALDMALAIRDDAAQRTLRGQLALATGKPEAALADFLRVLESMPTHEAVLSVSVDLLLRQGRIAEAIALVEKALAQEPRERLWAMRASLPMQSPEQQHAVLERWAAAMPGSGLCLDRQAQLQDGLGQSAAAQALARRALAIDPRLPGSIVLLLRHEVGSDPKAALQRAQELLAGNPPVELGREAERLRGLAFDRLGRHAEAAAAWLSMRQVRVAPHRVPEPAVAGAVPDGEVAGMLLWSPPGVRLDRVLPVLADALPGRLLLDRFGPDGGRDDGFGLPRTGRDSAAAGSARRWQAALAARGLAPAEVVDVLPHFDAYTAAALPGARTVALLADPRDTLLNWLVFGNAQGFAFPPDASNAARWLAACLEALADHRDAHPAAVSIVMTDAVDAEPAAVLPALLTALGLPAGAADIPAPRPASGNGMPQQVPSGHWRSYRESLAEPFALLQPVARRLGYPAE